MVQSEAFSTSTWTLSNSSVTANNTTSPEGLVNAYKLTENTANSSHRITQTSPTSSGQVYTQSIFAKDDGSGRFLRMFRGSGTYNVGVFNLTNGVVYSQSGSNLISADIVPYTNGWYKCSITFTAQFSNIASYIALQNGSLDSYTGDGTSGIYIYGASLELGTQTSYIPTMGTAQTRAADVCTGNVSEQFNSTEGVLYIESSAIASDSTNKVITISDGTTSNRVQIYFNSSNGITGGVAGQAAISYSGDITQNTKIAFKYKANDFALWINGVEVGTDSVGNAPSGLNQIVFHNGASGSPFYGNMKQLVYLNEAPSDSELATLTTL
jgi:hypothetical protein